MAQKSATCPGCRFGGEAILLQCAESIIIQIKIPLLILYLLSYVGGIQKMYGPLINILFPCRNFDIQMYCLNF
ncbi:hypothetical protein RUMOBE_02924 [Blautia obeum ATCC 29174]|uniref:Uncharacterized protein n=1 Tax=Blautia obeum ATCC 29174 TaxID=411459 RepID=A5ZV89_9FIRM|nr:hypothetical protein RUMOBE_02924 [Blautia obeum ATCC 29174]